MPKQDWVTDERKLQSVYEDISSGRHKPALSEVTRYLKKQPRSQPALILRAYLLHKLGSPITEVLAAWKVVENTGELTPRTLWWATLLMRSIGRLDLLQALYTRLWTANPENAELGQQVVLISVSLWDTPTMCTSSRKMFNLLKTTVWARIAAWAEWIDKTSCKTLLHPDDVFLPPAPENSMRIATTLLSTTKKAINSSEVLWLHVQILLAAGKEDAALAIVKLEGIGRGGIARSWWRIKTFQEVIRRMQSRTSEEDKKKSEAILNQEVDDFCWYMANLEDMHRNWANYEYIIQLLRTCYHVDKLVKIELFFNKLERKIGDKERAPLLASLHMSNIEEIRMPDEDFIEMVEKYWRKWGSKGVVVSDLQEVFKGREAAVASRVQAWSEEPHTDLNSYLSGKHARLLLFRLKFKGFVPSNDEFAYTWSYYMAGRTYGVNLPDTDIRPADDIGLAAVQVLILLSQKKCDEKNLFKAIICLRQICEDSPVCMQARFLLVRLYRLIGAPSLVAAPLEALKIAEIQLDTLLHIYSERASVDVGPGRTQAVFESCKERTEYMYHKTAMDLPEQLKTALEHESYSQISSIRQLQQTIKTSLPAAMLAIDSQRVSFLKGAISSLSEDISTELAFARDTDIGVDTRNWELVSLLVGDKPMREVLSLGQGDREWVKSWRGVYRLLREVTAEGPISSTFVAPPTGMIISAPEKCAISDINRMLQAAKSALQFGSDESADSPSDSDSLNGIGEAVIQHALAVTQSRWDRLQSASFLLELSRIVEAVSTRITAANKPKGKNKKAVKSPVITAFATSLETVRARLQEGKKEVVKSLEELHKADEKDNWVGMMRDCNMKDDLINTVRDEVIESRANAIANLMEMLN